MRKIYIIFLLPLVILFASCSRPEFRTLKSVTNAPVFMEARYWKGLFGGGGTFELRITNKTGIDLHECIMVIDGKYTHTFQGLHTKEKGLLKTSTLANGEQLTFQFGGEVDNLQFFEGAESGLIPKLVGMTCIENDYEWKME